MFNNMKGDNTMSKSENLTVQIEKAQKEIRQNENRLKELQQKHKVTERKERTRRLCERAGYLESILPATIPLSIDQFKYFLRKTLLTDEARQILTALAAQGSIGGESVTGEPSFPGSDS